jgi:MFS family permease
LLGPIYAIFVQNIGGNILSASSAWAIYTITIGVLTVIFGHFEQKLSWSRMLIWGRILTAVGIFGYFFVSNIYQLFAIEFILGVAASIKDPAYDSLFSKFLTKKKMSVEWGYQWGLTSIFGGMAALIGGTIATFFGFKTLFIIMAVSSSVSAALSVLLLRKKTWKKLFDVVHHR